MNIYDSQKPCAGDCGGLTHRHASAKYCWECSNKYQKASTERHNARVKLRNTQAKAERDAQAKPKQKKY